MRLKHFLYEGYLKGEYKFGFELEAITTDLTEATKFIFKYFKGEIKKDKSIGKFLPNEVPFEFASGIYSFTPQNIQNFIKLIEQLHTNNIRVNETCGFHIHLSYPHLDLVNTRWVMMNLSMDNKIRNLIEKFDDIDFFNSGYANKRFLDDLKESLEEEDYERMSHILDNEKYRTIRIHPQGTLEWRGPRGNWLNVGNVKKIKEFVNVLSQLVSWINIILDSKKLINSNLSKSYIINNLDNFGVYLSFDRDKSLYSMIDTNNQDLTILNDIVISNKWLLLCKFSNAIFTIKNNKLYASNITFKKGNWERGIWEDGTWEDGTWMTGKWKDGTWEGGIWKDGIWENGLWLDGIWEDGIWLNGVWEDGRWLNGVWENGVWDFGVWHNGIWSNGEWITGTWHNGEWSKGSWTDGRWENGVWKNGLWLDGLWKDGQWLKGEWKDGRIYSKKFNEYIQSSINPKEFYEIEMKCEKIKELEIKVK